MAALWFFQELQRQDDEDEEAEEFFLLQMLQKMRRKYYSHSQGYRRNKVFLILLPILQHYFSPFELSRNAGTHHGVSTIYYLSIRTCTRAAHASLWTSWRWLSKICFLWYACCEMSMESTHLENSEELGRAS